MDIRELVGDLHEAADSLAACDQESEADRLADEAEALAEDAGLIPPGEVTRRREEAIAVMGLSPVQVGTALPGLQWALRDALQEHVEDVLG